MNRQTLGIVFSRAALTLGVLGLLGERVIAQDAPIPWIQLSVVQVSPTMVDEFLSVQKELSARAKKARVPWRTVSRTDVFGDAYRFLIASPLETLASLDRDASGLLAVSG